MWIRGRGKKNQYAFWGIKRPLNSVAITGGQSWAELNSRPSWSSREVWSSELCWWPWGWQEDYHDYHSIVLGFYKAYLILLCRFQRWLKRFFLYGASSAKPARAGPCCCWVLGGACCWKQTGKGEMWVCVELCRRLLGLRWWVFWTGGMTETAVVLLCLLQRDFVSGVIVFCCSPHNRLKKRSRTNAISIKVVFFFFWAANTLEVMLSQEEIFEDGHNWRHLHQILCFDRPIKNSSRKEALVASFFC